MGAVLQRLALRALPGGPRVRPRLAGRYETASEPIESHAEPVVSATTAGTVDPSPRRAVPPAAEPPHDPGVPPHIALLARSLAEPAALPLAPLRANQPPPPATLAAESPATVARHGAEIIPREPGSSLPSAEPPAPKRLVPQPSPSIEQDGMADVAPPPPRAPVGLLLPELRITAGEGANALLPPAHPALASTDRETPPDVHISIGRIEVRADRPEPRKAQRPPARPRPKLMSLEDYLANGRGR